MAEILRPDGDITTGWLSGSYTQIDEATPSDTDYAYSTNNANQTLEVSLSNPVGTPSGTGTITVRFRHAQADSDEGTPAPSSGGNASSLTVALYEGVTSRGSTNVTTNEGSFVEASFTVDQSTITNFNDLRIRFDASGSGGPAANRRAAAVSWAEVEIQASAAPTLKTLTPSASGTASLSKQVRLVKAHAATGTNVSDLRSVLYSTTGAAGSWTIYPYDTWADTQVKVTPDNTVPTGTVYWKLRRRDGAETDGTDTNTVSVGGNTFTGTPSATGTAALTRLISLIKSHSAVGSTAKTREVRVTKAITAAGANAVTKGVSQAAKAITAVGASALSKTKVSLLTLVHSATGAVGTVTKEVQKTLANTATGATTLARRIGKTLSSSATGTASVLKRIGKSFSHSAIGTLVIAVDEGISRLFTYTAAGAATLTREIRLTLTHASAGTASLTKQFYKTLAAAATGAVSFASALAKTFSVTATGAVNNWKVPSIPYLNTRWRDALVEGEYRLNAAPDKTKGFYLYNDLNAQNPSGLFHHGADPDGDWLPKLWTASTFYAAGSYVKVSQSSYQVYYTAGGGTSGTTPPTGTGTGISDGGITDWAYYQESPGADLRPNRTDWEAGYVGATGFMGNLAKWGGGTPYDTGVALGARQAAIKIHIPNDETSWSGDPADNLTGPPWSWEQMQDANKDRRRNEVTTYDASKLTSVAAGCEIAPAREERWFGYAVYLPADFDTSAANMPDTMHIMQMKDFSDGLPCFTIDLKDGVWEIEHISAYSLNLHWTSNPPPDGSYAKYGSNYYSDPDYTDLQGDYTNGTSSRDKLDVITTNGWTFWAIHFRVDYRPKSAGGRGFLDVYKRDQGDSNWTQILTIRPRVQHIGTPGSDYDRGVLAECSTTGNGTHNGLYTRHGIYNIAPAYSTRDARPARTLYIGALVSADGATNLDGLWEDMAPKAFNLHSPTATGTAGVAKGFFKTLAHSAVGTAVTDVTRVILKSLAFAASGTVALTKQVQLTFAHAATGTASLLRRIGLTLANAATGTVGFVKQFFPSGPELVNAFMTAVGAATLTKTVELTKTFSAAGTTSLTRQIGLALAAIATGTASLVIAIPLSFAHAAVGSVVLTAQALHNRVLAPSAQGTVAVTKRIGKVLSNAASGAVAKIRQIRVTKAHSATGATVTASDATLNKSLPHSATGTATQSNIYQPAPAPGIAKKIRGFLQRLARLGLRR